MAEIPKNILRMNPYRGIMKILAEKYGVTHTSIGRAFWRPKNDKDFEIKKEIIAEMKLRKSNKPDDKLNKEILDLL